MLYLHKAHHMTSACAAHRCAGALLLGAMLVAIAGCQTGVRGTAWTEESPTPGVPTPTVTVPEPRHPVDIDPETVITTRPAGVVGQQRTPAAGGETPAPQIREVTAEIDETGPFTAADAADGKWFRINSVSGIGYILIPGELWASTQLNLNDGDSIRARGYLRTARNRTYLHAISVDVTQ